MPPLYPVTTSFVTTCNSSNEHLLNDSFQTCLSASMCLITPDKSRPMCLIVYLFCIEKMWAINEGSVKTGFRCVQIFFQCNCMMHDVVFQPMNVLILSRRSHFPTCLIQSCQGKNSMCYKREIYCSTTKTLQYYYNVIPRKVRQLNLKPVNETRKEIGKTNIIG